MKKTRSGKNNINDYPLITCPILTYNHFDMIYGALDSIIGQNYPNIEIGVFDDGSEDFPKEEIEDYINLRKRKNIKNVIIFHSDSNEGTVKNENKMIKMTSGKYIIEIGQDDRLYNSDVCKTIVDFFIKNDADVVTSYKQILYKDGRLGRIIPYRHNARIIKKADAYKQYKLISTGAPIAGAGTFYSRRILEKMGLFDETYILQEDGPFFLKTTRNGIKIFFLEKPTIFYRVGLGVSSGEAFNELLLEDIHNMFEREVKPYISTFNRFERKMIKYNYERITYKKKLSVREMMILLMKYGDVMLYRRIFAH